MDLCNSITGIRDVSIDYKTFNKCNFGEISRLVLIGFLDKEQVVSKMDKTVA